MPNMVGAMDAMKLEKSAGSLDVARIRSSSSSVMIISS